MTAVMQWQQQSFNQFWPFTHIWVIVFWINLVLLSQLRRDTWCYSEQGRSDSQSRERVVHIQHMSSGGPPNPQASQKKERVNLERRRRKNTGVSELYFMHLREQIPHTLTQAPSSTAAGFWSVSVSVKLCHLDLQVQKIEERHSVLSLNSVCFSECVYASKVV